jgi:hypothetical protein
MALFLSAATWIFVIILIFMIGLFSRRIGRYFEDILLFLRLKWIAESYSRVRARLHLYRCWRLWAGLVPLALFIQFLRVLSKYFIALGIGVSFPVVLYLFLVPLIDIVTAIPISIGGHGVREIAAAKVYGAAGMTQLEGIVIQELAYISLAVISLWGAYRFVLGKKAREAGV